jgi:hypothetical protein
MSYSTPGYQQQQLLYQADGPFVQQVKAVRNHLHMLCRQHLNQLVRIETVDGQIYVGRIVGCDRGLLQIRVPRQPAPGAPRAFYGYNDMILTLVLYELLVITLLYT